MLHLLCFSCGGSPLIMIDHEHFVCVILETHPLCSVSSSYAPIIDLHGAPGLDRLTSELVHAQDTSVTESITLGTRIHTQRK